VFGAPAPAADHASRAARAAVGMRKALDVFNTGEVQSGRSAIRIGIGVHCGEMVAGSVGSPNRMEYTVIGDVVNVASRIQGLNKEYGTEILVSRELYDAATGIEDARPLPPATVRGKSAPVVVYTLDDLVSGACTEPTAG
jgi:adenylate cyclase